MGRTIVAIVTAVLALALAALPIALALVSPGGLGGLAPPDQRSPSGEAINEL